MATATTDIIIGSIEQLPQQAWTSTAGAGNLAAGNYYLRHSADALNLLVQVANALNTAGETNVVITIMRDLKIRITADVSFAWNFGSATRLRDLLGFTGNLASSTTHDAPNISPLLWSPGYCGLPATIRNVNSYDIEDTIITSSNTGKTLVFSQFGTSQPQEFSWDAVPISRVHTSSELGGEFKALRDEVLVKGYRFQYYQDATEDSADHTTALTFPAALGIYKIRNVRHLQQWYRRKVVNADTWSPITIECLLQDEYS